MSDIQDNNWLYSTLRYYVDATFNLAYRRVEYLGMDKIPKDGAIIYAPNHTNALMDALAVLVVQHAPSVFVARADIFKKPAIAKILHFLKIMPIMRIRDGYNNLKKNDAIMKDAVTVLENKVPFCIMAEGTHRAMHSLLPLVKGIFRIALMANDELKDRMPVYIVPLGVEYGDYFRYRSTLLLQVGEPINVTQFVEQHANLDTPEMMNALRDVLSEHMKTGILYLPDDAYYEGSYDLCIMGMPKVLKQEHIKHSSLKQELEAKRTVAKALETYRQESTEAAESMLKNATTFSVERQKAAIAEETIQTGSWSFIKSALMFLGLLLTLPYFLYSFIVDSPVLLLGAWLNSKMDDRAFDNSVRYVIVLVLSPLIWIILGALFFVFLSWPVALGLTVAMLPSHIFLHAYWRGCRLLKSQWNWRQHKELRIEWSKLQKQLDSIL